MTERHRSLIELNAAVLIWGGTSLFAKWIELPAFEISALRSVVAALVLWVVLLAGKQSLRVRSLRDLGLMTILGVTLAIHWVTYFQAIQVSTVAVGILSLHTYPVITALMEPLVFREKLQRVDVVVALVVLAGVAVLVPEFSLESETSQGVLWGMLSAVFFTIRNLLSRWLVRQYTGLQLMLYQFVVVALVLLPFVAVAGASADRKAGWQLLVLGVAFTALPQTLFTNSLKHLSTKTVSVIATLLPIYGAILAAILLSEIPSLRTFVGGGIILGAVFFETWRAVRKQP